MSNDRIFIGKWIKKAGKLVFKSKVEEGTFHNLVKGMREGQTIDFFVDFSDDLGTLSQIAKLKAGTREIAKETGHDFIDIEQKIKKDAGLYNEVSDIYKSFGNCSRDELSSAIQVMINIGDKIGSNLR